MRYERWVVIVHPLGPSTGGQWPRTIRYGHWVVIVHPLGPSTGGQWPLTIRHERWVVIIHPLGPSTGTTQKKENLPEQSVILSRPCESKDLRTSVTESGQIGVKFPRRPSG